METWNKTEGPQTEAKEAVGCYVENDRKRKKQNCVIAIMMIILKQQMKNTCVMTEL